MARKAKTPSEPDWGYYGQLHQSCLWQAVALMHNIEPNDLLDDDGNFSVWNMSEPCREKVWIAQNHLKHALPILKLDQASLQKLPANKKSQDKAKQRPTPVL